jgi:hypothetical protein
VLRIAFAVAWKRLIAPLLPPHTGLPGIRGTDDRGSAGALRRASAGGGPIPNCRHAALMMIELPASKTVVFNEPLTTFGQSPAHVRGTFFTHSGIGNANMSEELFIGMATIGCISMIVAAAAFAVMRGYGL